MKKVLLFLIIILTGVSSKAQVFYKSEKLGTSRITGEKVGNIAGAYFTLGLSAANSSKKVEGKEAELEIKDEKPSFEMRFNRDCKDSLFTRKEHLDNIVMYKFKSKKTGSREIRTGKYGLTGIYIGVDEKGVIPIKIEQLNDSIFIVSPKEKLQKGQYCFYYTQKEPRCTKVYDFSIQ